MIDILTSPFFIVAAVVIVVGLFFAVLGVIWKDPTDDDNSGLFVSVATILLMSTIWSSCSPSLRSSKHFSKSYRIDKVENAKMCAAHYPPVTERDTVEKYIQGETEIFIDTTTVFDTVDNVVFKYITRIEKTTDTVLQRYETQVVDRASVVAIQGELERNKSAYSELKSDYDKMGVKRNMWRSIAIACIVLIIGRIAWKYIKGRVTKVF